MKEIKVILIDFGSESKEVKKAFYNNNTTLQELLESLGYSRFRLNFRKYYDFGYEFCISTLNTEFMHLPYVISGKEVFWIPKHCDVRVKDFLYTCKGINDIEVYIDIPAAEEPFFFTLVEMWNYYLPILSDLSGLISLGCFSVAFIKWLNRKFHRRTPTLPLMEFINKRDIWNQYELGELLKISKDDAIKLLKGFGYKWDTQIKAYIKTEDTKRIIDAIENIPWKGNG